MLERCRLGAVATVLLAVCVRSAAGFSTFAGSCKHAAVNHGLDRFAAQSGSGGYSISLAKPVADLAPGTTVNVKLSGTTSYKGILIFAEVNGKPSGSWGALGEGLQLHPSCKYAVTHNVYHLSGRAEDEIPWVVPTDFSAGDTVVFKATVVRSYSTWFALDSEGNTGAGGGDDGEVHAPQLSGDDAPNGVHAPRLGGGVHAPGETDDDGGGGVHAPRLGGRSDDGGSGSGGGGVHAPDTEERSVRAPRTVIKEEAPRVVSKGDADGGDDVGDDAPESPAARSGRARGADLESDGDDDAQERSQQQGPRPAGADDDGASALVSGYVARRRRLKVLHGVVMLAAWAFATPVGALTARYGKGRGPVWFDVHRVAQAGALGLTVAGVLVAIVGLKGGFVHLGPHGKVGITVLLAAGFQALIGWFRPPKTGGKGRVLWEKLHRTVGWSTLLGGLHNCWSGTRLIYLQEGVGLALVFWVLEFIFFVGVGLCLMRFGSLSRLAKGKGKTMMHDKV